MQVCAWMEFQFLIFGILVVEVFHSSPNQLNNTKDQTSNAKFSRFGAMLYIFEDNEAVIKMIIKGRSPTMRHVSRTHRVALDWIV